MSYDGRPASKAGKIGRKWKWEKTTRREIHVRLPEGRLPAKSPPESIVSTAQMPTTSKSHPRPAFAVRVRPEETSAAVCRLGASGYGSHRHTTPAGSLPPIRAAQVGAPR